MTHASVKGTELEVPENVVRLSVGIEDVDDLRRRRAAGARRSLSPSLLRDRNPVRDVARTE